MFSSLLHCCSAAADGCAAAAADDDDVVFCCIPAALLVKRRESRGQAICCACFEFWQESKWSTEAIMVKVLSVNYRAKVFVSSLEGQTAAVAKIACLCTVLTKIHS
jgi:hypothetical protein